MNRPDPKKLVEDWNIRHPVGTPVRYWTGVREGAGKLSKTTHAAVLLGGHTAVVWVEGEAGCIGLSHVEPEQRCGTCVLWGDDDDAVWNKKSRTCMVRGIPGRKRGTRVYADDGRYCDAYRPERTVP